MCEAAQVPFSTKQGIIFVEQEILAQEQGILPAKTKIIAGRGFRYTHMSLRAFRKVAFYFLHRSE